MNTLTRDRGTGSVLGDLETLATVAELDAEDDGRTHYRQAQVANPALREALAQFDRALTEPLAPLLYLHGSYSRATSIEPVTDASEMPVTAPLEFTPEGPHTRLQHTMRMLRGAFWRLEDGGPVSFHIVVTSAWDDHATLRSVFEEVAVPAGDAWQTIAPQGDDQATSSAVGATEDGDQSNPVDDAVSVVEQLSVDLGLSARDVLTAAGIKPRTYYSWREPDAPRPRLASQGRLWALAQAVMDLAELLDGPPRAWLLTRPERRARLLAGDFDALVEQATRERMRSVTSDEAASGAAMYAVRPEYVGDDTPTRTEVRRPLARSDIHVLPARRARRPGTPSS